MSAPTVQEREAAAMAAGWQPFPYLMGEGAGEKLWCPPGHRVHISTAQRLPDDIAPSPSSPPGPDATGGTTPMVTERQAVGREREAFASGAEEVFDRFHVAHAREGADWRGADALAVSRYPLPRETRRRTWTDPRSNFEFRVVDGQFESRDALLPEDESEWKPSGKRPEAITALADLLAHPVEDV